jgi:hypothetical protein
MRLFSGTVREERLRLASRPMLRGVLVFAYDRLVDPIARRFSSAPTPREKVLLLISYGRRHGTETLIETGTYHGATVAACRRHFKRIYTIELDQALYAAAKARFGDDSTVTVIHGDSYTELNRLASDVEGPALFWLDAHYSAGETAKGLHDPPLPWELRAIVSRGERDVILIDDARLMGVNPGYPSVEEIRQIIGERELRLEIRRDIIRITLA